MTKLLFPLATIFYGQPFTYNVISFCFFLETHLENVDKLNRTYEEDRDTLIDYAEFEKDDFLAKAGHNLEYLKTVAHAQSTLARKNVNTEYEEHNVKIKEMICEVIKIIFILISV